MRIGIGLPAAIAERWPQGRWLGSDTTADGGGSR